MKHGDASTYGTSDEHYTPKELFDKLGLMFELDVASPINNTSHVPAFRKYTILDDGLSQPWFGRVWMNPPYSKPTPWVDKFIEHGNGIALLPFTRGQWWQRLWAADCAIVPLAYNFKFDTPSGKAKPISFLTALYAMGDENKKALHNIGAVVR